MVSKKKGAVALALAALLAYLLWPRPTNNGTGQVVINGFTPGKLVNQATLTLVPPTPPKNLLLHAVLYDASGIQIGRQDVSLVPVPPLSVPTSFSFSWQEFTMYPGLPAGTYSAVVGVYDCGPPPPFFGSSCILLGAQLNSGRYVIT